MTQIDHLGIAVKSLAEAKKFYEKLGSGGNAGRDCGSARRSGSPWFRSAKVAWSCWSRPRPTRPLRKFLEKRGAGLHHVALQVTNLAGTVEELKAAGTRLIIGRSAKSAPVDTCMSSFTLPAPAACCWNWWKKLPSASEPCCSSPLILRAATEALPCAAAMRTASKSCN